MHFAHIGAQALLAVAIVVSSVASVPARIDSSGTGSLTADGPAASILSPRSAPPYTADDAAVQIFTASETERLAKRTKPPTLQELQDFFSSKANRDRMSLMVFWSGTGVDQANDFARAKGRYTLEMLLENKWDQFKEGKDKDSSNYWATFSDAVNGFWDLAAQSCAQATTGEVYVFLTPQRDIEQQATGAVLDVTRPKCEACWFRVEKPALIANLETNKVNTIAKYYSPSPGTYKWTISSMADKI